jgi:hypothetical protein
MVLSVPVAAMAAPVDRTPESSAHADDGNVETAVSVGGRVVVGGTFTRVDGQVRNGLAALDAKTGALLSSLRVTVDGEVAALATDGATVYLGGKFNTVNGVRRNNLAAVDAATGQLRTGFNPSSVGSVRALGYLGGRLYVGGGFTKIAGVSRANLAALDATTGAASSFPTADGTVQALTVSGSSVYVGGDFSHVGGTARNRVAALSASGAVLSYQASGVGPVFDIAVDASGVYLATAGGLPTGNSLYKTTATGAKVWQVATDGNLQSVQVVGDTVYGAGHFGHLCGSTSGGCGDTTLARKVLVANASGSTPNARAWARFNTALGVFDLHEAGGNLYAFGVFTKVNGKVVPRIARFAE